MRHVLLLLIVSMPSLVYCQNARDLDFLFDDTITQKYGRDFNGIVSVMADYYEGVEYADGSKLDSAFHSSWQMRDNDGTDNNFIHIEDKATFIQRVTDHGNYEGYASQRKIGAVELIHDQLAFVRIDKAPTRTATLFFLARIENTWKMIDKLWVYPQENYKALPSPELLSAMRDYYEGNIQQKGFDSKSVSVNGYEVGKPSRMIAHETKLVSMLGVYDRLAVVRTDYPALRTTVFIVLFRLDDGWTVACERISSK